MEHHESGSGLAIDPRLLEFDKNRARNNIDLNKEERAAQHAGGQTQSTFPVYPPGSEPSAAYRGEMTGSAPIDWQLRGSPTWNDMNEDPQTAEANHHVDTQTGIQPEDSSIQGLLQAVSGAPQARSPTVANGSQNKKARGPFSFKHPVIQEYVKELGGKEHLLLVLKAILRSKWYKKGRQEQPPDEELLNFIQKRPSSSTPISLFGVFFSAKRPYTCLLCPKGSPACNRSLERAFGHSRWHFGFKLKQGKYTNVNTENDLARRAKNPTKDCTVCGKPFSKQNYSRHLKTQHPAAGASSSPAIQMIASDAQ